MSNTDPKSEAYAAFAEVLSAVTPVKKADKAQFKFANMNRVYGMVLPILEKHGFIMYHYGENTQVVSVLVHMETGVEFKSSLPLGAVEKLGPQDVGKAVTYHRRYNILALLNVITEDDDGTSAQNAVQGARKAPVGTKASAGLDDLLG